jgi:hypothetical protein
MFGHNDQQDEHKENEANDLPAHTIDGALSADAPAQVAPAASSQDWQHPGQPLDAPAPTASDDNSAQQDDHSDFHVATPYDDGQQLQQHTDARGAPAAVADPELLDIKRDALNELTPLVSHLDQSPEERFRTTMMMIQANDNQALIKDAYEAAHAIEDQTARAQALLDVINEINYFTSQQH